MRILEKGREAAQLMLSLLPTWRRTQVQGHTGRENRGATISFWEGATVVQTVSPAEGLKGKEGLER